MITVTDLIQHGIAVGPATQYAGQDVYLLTGSYGSIITDPYGVILHRAHGPEYDDHARFDLDEWRQWAPDPTARFLDITEANVILTDGSVLPASADFRSHRNE